MLSFTSFVGIPDPVGYTSSFSFNHQIHSKLMGELYSRHRHTPEAAGWDFNQQDDF